MHIDERFLGSRAGGRDRRADEPEIQDKVNQQAAELHSEHGLEARVHVSRTPGNTAKAIAEISDEVSADLIVVGTRGHSPVAGAILRSTTRPALREN